MHLDTVLFIFQTENISSIYLFQVSGFWALQFKICDSTFPMKMLASDYHFSTHGCSMCLEVVHVNWNEFLCGCEEICVGNQDEFVFFCFFFSSWQSQIVTQVVIGNSYIVANRSSCYYFIQMLGWFDATWKACCSKQTCFLLFTTTS